MTEPPDGFKYDVAFSFLQEDESIAQNLATLLKDRWRAFVYSEQQKRLAGTDGEKRFNVIFGQESRLVVILYRPEWGHTKWTRIEDTAIRNRAYEHGYGFIFLALLEKPPPEWIPKTYLYANHERFGAEGTAQAIDGRLEEMGAAPVVESLEAQARRLAREKQEDDARLMFLDSAGYDAAFKAAHELVATLLAEGQRVGITVAQFPPDAIATLRWDDLMLRVGWTPPRSRNKIAEGELEARCDRDSEPSRPHGIVQPRRALYLARYRFDVAPVSHEARWRLKHRGGAEGAVSTSSLARKLLRQFLTIVDEKRDR